MKRVLLVVLGCVLLGGVVFGFVASRNGTPAPGPLAKGSTSPTPSSVPAAAMPPNGVHCPASWRYFDNPALHYGICYPPSWGIWLEAGQRSAAMTISVGDLFGIHLVGMKAFPFRSGQELIHEMVARDFPAAELDMFQAGETIENSCKPSIPIHVDKLTARYCEDRYDIGGPGRPSDVVTRSAAGKIRSLFALVPLRRAPEPSFPGVSFTGARLVVSLSATSRTYALDRALFFQILTNIHLF